TQVSIITKSLTVGIIKYTNSSVVTDIVRGMKAELSIKGLIDGENIKYLEYSASGNPDLLPGFVDMLIAAKVDIIVPVSTPASQAAVLRAPENIPVIFTYVTDPESAGIIGVRKHVSGLSDATNFKDFLAFVRQLLPQFTSHGHIYNPNESNSTFAYNQLHLLSGLYGFTIKSYPVNSGGDIMSAYTSLKMDNMKSILIVADNTMSAGISVLSGLADNDNIAVIGDSYEHARDGALAAISVDYDALSKSAGDMVLSVLLGMDPDNMPVQKFSTDVISINTATAGKIGFTFPQEIKDKAKYVFP
ncbi:MAG: putative tryptophan/tyrosine transport system substrate-binding protein, partial [Bacteroidota bacterium]|nr:putative tryptophan/tyrosine transport system substrate-binding protein [Bacteroidota bacterium]